MRGRGGVATGLPPAVQVHGRLRPVLARRARHESGPDAHAGHAAPADRRLRRRRRRRRVAAELPQGLRPLDAGRAPDRGGRQAIGEGALAEADDRLRLRVRGGGAAELHHRLRPVLAAGAHHGDALAHPGGGVGHDEGRLALRGVPGPRGPHAVQPHDGLRAVRARGADHGDVAGLHDGLVVEVYGRLRGPGSPLVAAGAHGRREHGQVATKQARVLGVRDGRVAEVDVRYRRRLPALARRALVAPAVRREALGVGRVAPPRRAAGAAAAAALPGEAEARQAAGRRGGPGALLPHAPGVPPGLVEHLPEVVDHAGRAWSGRCAPGKSASGKRACDDLRL
mmetsp:Transcript_16948/g.48215  ORF Transcript_16948/g.48215 Transcript_16948/m.48215 type:complete len:339 (+) Transcript_16948:270-1286(+)